ncbi:MAG: aryl-sulfate sulfotransferase, partial [Gemmatimonadaceae bacterium]
SLIAPDNHGYLVAFDGAGNIRWFRDFGNIGVQEAKQQTNGDFTVFVGNSYGDNATAGAFVELTPEGDSVRAITATGSPYTDGHELQVVSDANGHRIADYLSGYDIRSVDQTAYGGGPADQLAGHQLLRINAAGTVDTLIQGWGYWTHDDKVDPPTADQSIDHPNSISFDVDGGVIVSYRNLGAVIKINPQTRAVLWQMGGTRNQFSFINDPLNGFGGQHDVQVLPNGHFIVFDNGVTHTPQSTRAVEYAVDESARTATMVWQYAPSPSLFNEFTGSVQRLSNGNTVIAWTNAGLIDEVSSNGTLIDRMQIYNSPGVANTSEYRAIRINNLYRYVKP